MMVPAQAKLMGKTVKSFSFFKFWFKSNVPLLAHIFQTKIQNPSKKSMSDPAKLPTTPGSPWIVSLIYNYPSKHVMRDCRIGIGCNLRAASQRE